MTQKQKALSKEEEILLQDFSRNVSTKSNALFYGNAFIVSAIPICEFNLTKYRLVPCSYLLLLDINCTSFFKW
jgi:translocon-associated protein subunit gamma